MKVHAIDKIIMDCYSFEGLISITCSQKQLDTFTIGIEKVAFAQVTAERSLFEDLNLAVDVA